MIHITIKTAHKSSIIFMLDGVYTSFEGRTTGWKVGLSWWYCIIKGSGVPALKQTRILLIWLQKSFTAEAFLITWQSPTLEIQARHFLLTLSANSSQWKGNNSIESGVKKRIWVFEIQIHASAWCLLTFNVGSLGHWFLGGLLIFSVSILSEDGGVKSLLPWNIKKNSFHHWAIY